MHEDIDRVLIPASALQDRVDEVAQQIASAYESSVKGLTIVAVLSGSIIFLGDLIRRLPMRMRIGLIAVSSYPGSSTKSHGAVVGGAALSKVRDRDVLIIDDILDSGGTLRVVQAEVRRAGAKSVRTAVLLRKPDKAPPDLPVDFVGFDIEDVFVVGYGLDYDGLYRNLPFVGVLRPELYAADTVP